MKEQSIVSLLLLFGIFRNAIQLTWNMQMLSTTCCQGNSSLLSWNFTIGESERVMELQWFFNETKLICLDSKTDGFLVEPFYVGRVERNGIAGILLKNVSLDDTGEYTLHVKLDEEKEQTVQRVVLTVLVPYQCKPSIEIQSQNIVHCSTSSCGRSEYSPEWITNGTDSEVIIGQDLKINESTNKQAFCCLRDLKCHDDDRFKFCVPYHIPSIGTTVKEDIHRIQFEKGSANEVTVNQLLILLVVVMVLIVLAVIKWASSVLWKRFKSFCPTWKRTEDPQQVDNAAGTTDNRDPPETTFEPPDATSEPLVHHDEFGSIQSSIHQATHNDYQTMNEHNQK